jgi:hypothetical protein
MRGIQMYRNWPAISKVANPWLRMLAVTADDPETLQGLQAGFPQLFSEEETESRIPLSAIRLCVEQSESSLWSIPLEHFSIPALNWGAGSELSITVPHEWWSLMESLKPNDQGAYDLLHEKGDPVYIDWNGQRCLLVEMWDYDPEDGTVESLTIVPEQFIDLKS